MRTFYFIASVIVVTLWACSGGKTAVSSDALSDTKPKKTVAPAKGDTVRIANDSLEYEIIIIDPGFNSWLASRAKPRNFYNQRYLESRNLPWVIEWNQRCRQPRRYGNLYEWEIDYRASVNYGYEVNYLLYNYLVYFQQTNRQRLGIFQPEF